MKRLSIALISMHIGYTLTACAKDNKSKMEKKMQKAKIQVYSTDYCPYCVRAKELLQAKGLNFDEIDVTNDHEMRVKLVEMTGGLKTVPQIIIDGKSIGGYDSLCELDKDGKLNEMVN